MSALDLINFIPHSVDSEHSVLGSILINDSVVDSIATLKPDHFYVEANNLKSRWSWVMANKAGTKEEGLDFFGRLFAYISKSDFLMGRSSSWNCDLGWIVNATNFSKIIDGNYDNKVAA